MFSTSFSIRSATNADVNALAALGALAAHNTRGSVDLSELGLSPAVLGELIADCECCYVAEVGLQIAGFVLLDTTDRCIYAAFARQSPQRDQVVAGLEATAACCLEMHADS